MTEKSSGKSLNRGGLDGVVRAREVETLGARAYARYGEFDGSQGGADDRLGLLVLSVICRIWTSLLLEMDLKRPAAKEGTAEFTAQLAREMALQATDAENIPTIGYVRDAFSAVANLCHDIADGRPSVLIGEDAFYAGLMVGAVQNVGSEVDQVAWAEMHKTYARERKRLKKVGATSLKKRKAMVALGLAEIAADPAISNMALQRRFRALHVGDKGLNTTSNNEARMFGRMRGTELPKRIIGKQASNPRKKDSTESSSE